MLTPQLTQAIKLLALSNLELDAYVAEELAKNPLLEARGEDEGEAPEAAAVTFDDEAAGDDAPDDPGADDLILAKADDDRPLDMDWQAEALETDSFADVGGSAPSDEGFDFDRLEASESSLSEHLLEQLHGLPGPDGALGPVDRRAAR